MSFGQTTRIMGILNVTPDSFSDGGKFFRFEDAVSQGIELVRQGADILDIGGESTRPFAETVSEDEEIRRVVPLIERLSKRIDIPISIDTTKAGVARAAIGAGASIINDISALRFDPNMADVAKAYGTPVILMHMLGDPKTMQIKPDYGDVVSEVFQFLSDAISRAGRKGIQKSSIIVDPGIGFGKNVDHNLALIRNLGRFLELEVPILIGPSRKAFIRRLLSGGHDCDVTPDSEVVITGTQAAVSASVLNGAHMIRVHDVEIARATLKIIDAVKHGQ
ncbi:MAG: dihydropteroate synthase [Thermodesulfobacteriota bacterium]